MLILLPPSEGKASPARGRPLDLSAMAFPELTAARRTVLDGLVTLCGEDPAAASSALSLTTGQRCDVARNAALRTAPTAIAGRVYSGVLYEALGYATLSAGAKRRAATRLAVGSALFGLVRLTDRIPAYKLPGDSSLPGLGTVASVWRGPLSSVLEGELDRGLVVDLRSGTYASYWRPGATATRFVTVRVLQETNGVRSVVSHFNKSTKGRLVRALLEDGAAPGSVRGLRDALVRLGWRVETADESRPTLDVIVTHVH